jgi:hypothetical protein
MCEIYAVSIHQHCHEGLLQEKILFCFYFITTNTFSLSNMLAFLSKQSQRHCRYRMLISLICRYRLYADIAYMPVSLICRYRGYADIADMLISPICWYRRYAYIADMLISRICQYRLLTTVTKTRPKSSRIWAAETGSHLYCLLTTATKTQPWWEINPYIHIHTYIYTHLDHAIGTRPPPSQNFARFAWAYLILHE